MVNENEAIYKAAYDYLLSFKDITKEMIEAQLNNWKDQQAKTISELCKKMISHSQNRQGMPNSIGDIDKISSFVINFQPDQILQKYNSWEQLFDKIKENYTPPGRMVKENSHNYWVQFCKSILSISKFLSKFETIDKFNKFVEVFYYNEETRVALPLLIQEEIFGYRFALACDFLKESGYPEFIKPDTHIRDIFTGLNLTKGESDFQIFKDAILFAKSINKLPYEVDKLFWLVGSGRFYLFQDKNGNEVKIKTSKTDFINSLKHKL